jgi:ATP/maltotriose-dependent transcriptional regulator MalT
MRGQFDRGRELYRQALANFEELGLRVDAATVSLSSSRVELLAGEPAAAEAELRRGYDYFSDIGERYLLSSVAGLLAEAVAVQGRWDEAEALARETEELAAPDDVDAQTLWRLAQARVCLARGDVVEAEALSREAVELLRPTDYVVNQISALATLAWALREAGSNGDAAEAFARAEELARAKGSPIMLGSAGELDAAGPPVRPAAR